MRLFSPNSPLMQKLDLVFDLMLLNCLTVILSVPVVTIGAAASALYDATWRLKRHEGNILRQYFKAFRGNCRQATWLFMLLVLMGLFLAYDWILITQREEPVATAIQVILTIGSAVWIMIAQWVLPLQSRFENTWGKMLINALICAVRFLPYTLAMLAITLVPWVVLALSTEYFLRFGIAWLLLWFGLSAYWKISLLKKPFDILAGEATALENQTE